MHKSIKYGIWSSTDSGNRKLDAAFRETFDRGPIYLFFSVNASGQFSGMAQMVSALDYTKTFDSWGQDKWNGTFTIKWTYIKDIPNNQFRHIVLANNENKSVTNSRDTQEIMLDQGREMLRIFHHYESRTSILDDFTFYDKRQELTEARVSGCHTMIGKQDQLCNIASARLCTILWPTEVACQRPDFNLPSRRSSTPQAPVGCSDLSATRTPLLGKAPIASTNVW